METKDELWIERMRRAFLDAKKNDSFSFNLTAIGGHMYVVRLAFYSNRSIVHMELAPDVWKSYFNDIVKL
jgi:hypothetical protein